MPLTHVCVWDSKVGYRRISTDEASTIFHEGNVSVDSGHFMCELCAQNVGLSKVRKDTGNRYFYHSRGEQDKTCEDRQQSYDRPMTSLNSHPMPIRIKVNSISFVLQIGFFLPSKNGMLNPSCEKIKISGDFPKAYEYNFSRIESEGITYLDVGNYPSRKYRLEYIASTPDLERLWPSAISGIEPAGTLFDCQSGKILQAGSKAYVQKSYYLLKRGILDPTSDITVQEITQFQVSSFGTWHLYQISSRCFSKRAAQFFFRYSIFLTENQVKLYPIWPVCISDPYFIYHELPDVFLYMHGNNVELKSYPVTSGYLALKSQNTENGQLIRIYAREREQLLSLGISGALGFTYLIKRRLDMQASVPSVRPYNANEKELELDHYASIPPKKYITITAPFDGKVIVIRDQKIFFIGRLVPDVPLTVDSITFGTEIHIYQGCDKVRTVCFRKETISDDTRLIDQKLYYQLKTCHGEMITLPHSTGALAEMLDDFPKTKQWLYSSVRKGRVPRSAYQKIINFIDNNRRTNL